MPAKFCKMQRPSNPVGGVSQNSAKPLTCRSTNGMETVFVVH